MSKAEEAALLRRRQEMGLDDIDPMNPNAGDDEPEDDEEEETDIDEEEIEPGEDDDDPVDHARPKKYIPIKEHQETRRRMRETEEERDRLATKLKEFEAAAESKPPVNDDEIRKAATDMAAFPAGATEEQKQQIVTATEAQLKRILGLAWSGAKLSGDEKNAISSLQNKLSEFEDKELFNTGWEELSGQFEKVYPSASQDQYRKARAALDDLWHAEQFADKEVDYVFFKNRDIFDEIFARRSKTFESRDTYMPPDRDGDDDEDSSKFNPLNTSTSKLVKMREKMAAEAARQESEGGWKILKDGRRIG